MDLPAYRVNDCQMRLFENERVIGSLGECRVQVGELFEELTERVSNARRFRTDSRKVYCPDLEYLPRKHSECRQFFEVKGCGKSGQVVLYDDRLRKDLEFIEQYQCGLTYWIWKHLSDVVCYAGMPVSDLRLGITRSLESVSLIDVRDLWVLVQDRKLRVVNHYQGGEKTGWTIPYSSIQQTASNSKLVIVSWDCVRQMIPVMGSRQNLTFCDRIVRDQHRSLFSHI